MRAFKISLILGLTFTVLTVCFFEFKKQMDLKPQIELVESKHWSLTKKQMLEFEKINQDFASKAQIKTFVPKFTNVFSSLSHLAFIEDARWAWDHNHPFKIKAFVAKPKAMMFKNGEWYLVNEKGEVLRHVEANKALDLPIFRTDQLLKNEELRNQTFNIFKVFDSPESPIPLSAVSEISVDQRGISFLLSEGFKVYISDNDPETQIERTSNVIAYLKKEKIEVEFIDAQSIQKILVRPKSLSEKHYLRR